MRSPFGETDHFARVHQVAGIEGHLDLAHQIEIHRPLVAIHIVELDPSDPVLGAEAAAHFYRSVEDQSGQFVFGIVQRSVVSYPNGLDDGEMDIAVTEMAEGHAAHT